MEKDNHKSNEKQITKTLALLDDWKTARILRRHLSHFQTHPAEIQFAKNLAQALYKLRNEHFDLMILDYKMSSPMTAKEVLELFHELKVEIPILVIVDRGNKQAILELIKIGASSHIAKDKLTSESLEKTIKTTIDSYKPLDDRNYNRRILDKIAAIYTIKDAPKSTICP